ncbi:S-adenosyl-L-methionine-dependent methyltransferase [Phakopsora pachyrhizi]|uniref:S-adenosyl-L-methionine-dependent methyltransferase n=1 Tax=Phakopsora pachyrhizi TaxID=170000 RepID=A0AAV0AJ22_PHAPC|nr:S-adenosyl-L-methionine-dependent methyltransferase [Phakopsora pachyrhizi]CAH7668474.1 S-adenosyl-L-methionine-dependent methyltransferase [Phakopsora pachyrhizi]
MACTFSDASYSAAKYAAFRPKYPSELYEAIMSYHEADNEVALDLGCGTGVISDELVQKKLFERVIGIDPSKGMLEYARKTIPQAVFMDGRAESIPSIENESVDLIMVGTAAHWFEPSWWQEAERVLKPRGTVAVFIYGGLWPEPSHPCAEELRATMFSFADELGFSNKGNLICHEMYDQLQLPDERLVELGDYKRIDWNRYGLGDKLVMSEKMNLKTYRERIHTYGPMHRWRIANPSKLGKKDEDPAEKTLEKLKKILGTQDEDTEIDCGHSLSLILFRRKSL